MNLLTLINQMDAAKLTPAEKELYENDPLWGYDLFAIPEQDVLSALRRPVGPKANEFWLVIVCPLTGQPLALRLASDVARDVSSAGDSCLKLPAATLDLLAWAKGQYRIVRFTAWRRLAGTRPPLPPPRQDPPRPGLIG